MSEEESVTTEQESVPEVQSTEVQPEEGDLVELMRVSMNGEEFLMPVQDVGEILRPIDVVPVPMAPDHMLGLANIRGQIVCIIDPGKVLHLKQDRAPRTEATRYLILRHARMHLGIWVDSVSDMYRVAKSLLPKADPENHTNSRGEIMVDDKSYNLLNTRILFD